MLIGKNDSGEIVEKRVSAKQKDVKKAFLEGQGYRVEEFVVVEKEKEAERKPPSAAVSATVTTIGTLVIACIVLFVVVPGVMIGLLWVWSTFGLPGFLIVVFLFVPITIVWLTAFAHAKGAAAKGGGGRGQGSSLAVRSVRRRVI
jgi:hypothetical protein